MRFNERAAGAVVYIIKEKPLYLLLHNKYGWDVPHGLIKPNEAEEAAALREIYEETKLKVELIPGFKERTVIRFSRGGRTIYKEIVVYLARASYDKVELSREHDAFLWLDYVEALNKLSRDEMRRVLVRANMFIQSLAYQRGQ
ncbi:MAG: NUDIX domain-containing protein [Thermoproteus sp.]